MLFWVEVGTFWEQSNMEISGYFAFFHVWLLFPVEIGAVLLMVGFVFDFYFS